MGIENKKIKNAFGRVRKFLGTKVGKFVAIVILWYLALLVFNSHSNFYSTVTVDLEYENRPVQISRIVKCETVSHDPRSPSGDLTKFGTFRYWGNVFYNGLAPDPKHWEASPKVFSEVMGDGSTLLISNPYLCEREKNSDGDIVPLAFEKGFLPLVGWTPDGPAAYRLEAYDTPAYYENSNTRVKNVKTTISANSVFAYFDYNLEDSFAWFNPRNNKILKSYYPKKYKEKAFYSFGGIIFEAKDWRGQDKEFDSYIDTLKEPTLIKENLRLTKPNGEQLKFDQISYKWQKKLGMSYASFKPKRLGANELRFEKEDKPFSPYALRKIDYRIEVIDDKVIIHLTDNKNRKGFSSFHREIKQSDQAHNLGIQKKVSSVKPYTFIPEKNRFHPEFKGAPIHIEYHGKISPKTYLKFDGKEISAFDSNSPSKTHLPYFAQRVSLYDPETDRIYTVRLQKLLTMHSQENFFYSPIPNELLTK